MRCEEWPGNLRESHRGLAGVDDISSDGSDLEESEDARCSGHGMGLNSALDRGLWLAAFVIGTLLLPYLAVA